MALNIKRLKLIDKAFLITLLLILSLGLVIQSSASLGLVSDASYYVKKQLLMIGVGLLGAFFIIRYDTSELKSFGPLLYLLSLGLLIAVLLFGTEVRGTTGWISLGPLPAIQPAEFTKIMLIVAPTTPTTAFKLGEQVGDPLTLYMNDILTVPVNMAGLPGMSIPCGFLEGMPVGLQLIGRAFDEGTLLRAAYAFEQHSDYHQAKPDLGGELI
jgi:hypothetical protein